MKDTEMEINLYDLFWYMCSKWKFIIMGSIIGLIIIGGLGIYKNVRSGISLEEVNNEQLYSEFTFVERSRISQCLYLESMYKKILLENENDPLMSMDYSNMYKSNLTYTVMNNGNSIVISNLLVGKIKSLWAELGDLNKFNSISLIYDNTPIYNSVQEEKYDKPILISMTIYGETIESSNELIKKIENTFEESYIEISQLFGNYTLNQISIKSYFSNCSELEEYILNKKNEEYSWMTNFSSLINSLTESGRQYVSNTIEQSSDENNIIDKNKEVFTSIKNIINYKFIIIGILTGIFIVSGIYFLLYIFNRRLRYEDDIETIYDINLLGRISLKEEKNKVDRFLQDMRRSYLHKFNYEEFIDMIVSELKVLSSKNKVDSIYMTGCYINEEHKKIIRDIKNKLLNNDIEIICGKPILYFSDALEESVEKSNVLFIETSNISTYLEIEQEIQKTKARGVNILGIIVIE